MTEDPFSHASPWGRCRPSGWGGFWFRASRAFPAGWPWSRFALLARRLARRSLHGPVDTRLWGLRLRLYPDRSVSEARILFLPRSWDRVERGLLREWIEPGFTFVDVGANAGAYSFRVLSLAGEGGRVVAVEPDPALARQLRYNVGINGAGERMRVVEAAVSAVRGEGTLLLASRNSGENRLVGEGDSRPIAENAPVAEDAGTGNAADSGSAADARNSTVPVSVTTLADLVAEAGLDCIDCLKVDVEGHEGDVVRPYLSGAPRSRWPRHMIVELAHRPGAHGDGPEELQSWITARGVPAGPANEAQRNVHAGVRRRGGPARSVSNPDMIMNEPGGGRGRSCCGVQRLGDEVEERLAGPLDLLARHEAVHGVRRGVKLLEGDARLQKAVGPGQRSELFERGHDQLLGVLPAAVPVRILDLDREEAGG